MLPTMLWPGVACVHGKVSVTVCVHSSVAAGGPVRCRNAELGASRPAASKRLDYRPDRACLVYAGARKSPTQPCPQSCEAKAPSALRPWKWPLPPDSARRLVGVLKSSVIELGEAALSVDLLNYQAKTNSCSMQSLPRKMLHKRVYETHLFRNYHKFFNASRLNRPLNNHPPFAACKRSFCSNSWTNTNPTPEAKPGATNKKSHSRYRKWLFSAPS